MATETDIYPVGPTIDNANRLRATRGLLAIGAADEPLTPEQQSLGAPQQPDEQKQAELEGHVNGWIKSHDDLLLNEQFNQIKDKTAQKAVVDDLSANIESEVDALHDKGIPSFAITNIRSALDEQRKRSHAMIDAGDRPLTPQQINDELDKRHADLRDLPTGGKKEHAQAVYQAVSAALNSEKFKKGGHIAKHMGLRPDFVEKDGAILGSATKIEKELHKMANDEHWAITNIVDSGLRSAISLAAGVAGRRAQDMANITTANYDPKDPSEVATIAAYRDFEQEMKAKYNPKADMTGQFAGMVVGGGAVFKAVKGVTNTARSLRIVSRAAQALNMTQKTWKTTGSLLTLGISAANLASSKHGTTFNPMEKGYLKDFALESVKLAMLHAVGAGTARLFSRSIVRAMAPTLQFNKWVGTGLGMSAAGATNWAGMRGMEVMEAAFGDSHKSFTDQLRDDWLGQMDYETLKRKGMPIGMWGGEVGLGAAAGGVGAWKGASSYADVMEAYRAARARADAKYHSGEFGFEAHNYVTSQIDDAYTNRMKPKQREAFLDDAERYRKIWNDSNGAGRDITDATEAYKTAESLRNSDSPLAATQADNSGDTSALIAQQKLMTALAKQKAKKKAAMEERMLRGETPTEETKPSEPTTPAPHPIIAQIDSVVAAHASELAALGHPLEFVLVTIPDESGGGGFHFNQKTGKIEYDPVRIEKVTIGMTPRQLAKYIRRGIAEEIIHVATDKYASESPENEAKLHAILKDAEAVAAAEKAYGKNAFEKLNETQKAFEVARVLIQGPRALTEAAYRFFKDLLRWLAQKVKNLSPETKELLDGIKAKMEAHESGKVEDAKTERVSDDEMSRRRTPLSQKDRRSLQNRAEEVVARLTGPERAHAERRLEEISRNHQQIRREHADAKTVGEKLQLEMEMVETENDWRKITGEAEIDIYHAVTAEDIKKDAERLYRREQEIKAKLKNGEAITPQDRQDWKNAGMNPEELPKETKPGESPAKPALKSVEHTQANEGPLTERAAYGRTGDVYDAFGKVQRKAGEPKNEKAQSVPSVQKADEPVRLPQKEVAPAAPSPEPVTPVAAKPVEQPTPAPKDTTERIQEAAYRDASGKIYKTGAFHDSSKLPKKFQADNENARGVEPGWLTSSGRFVGREEGFAIAAASKQVKDSYKAEWPNVLGHFNVKPETLGKQPTTAQIEQAIADANWLGTVREVPAPRSMGGEGVKLYIPVDASGKDVSVGGQTILGKTPAEAIELAQKNTKPAPAPPAAAPSPATPQSEGGIFGYSWADIRSKQQGGTLAALIRGNAPKATESDFAVLEEHGMDWLYDNKKRSIIDRLGLPVDKPSKKAEVKPKPPAQSFTEKVRAKIVPGAKVSVQLVRGAKLAHPAVVGDVFMDSNGKPESVSVTFDGGGNIKKGRTQTVPFGNVSLRPGVESRMLTSEQFEGMKKEEAQKTRAAAKEFKKLVIEYPELGFYSGHLEAVAAGPQGESAIKKARADAYVKAMTALGVHPDKADARDAVTQASLVEKLRELTKKPGMERKQYADFQEAKEEGDGEIKAGDLKYGETINIGGEEMRVTDIDKDGVVTLQDGEKFGTQEVHPDESLMIKGETPEPVAPKLRPSDGKGTGELLQGDAAPFNLVAETAADIAKREAREAAEQIAKDAKDAAEAKAKQDKEQGNLFDDDPFTIADTAPATSLPVESVQRAVRVVAGRLAGAMPHEVIADGSQYPQRVKDAFRKKYGASGDLNRIRGVVVGGRIYINAAAIENAREAIETFMHEAAGHGGVDALLKAFGEKATTQLDAMLKRLFPDDYAAVQRSYEPHEQVSETLARIMQRVGPEMSAQARTRWQRVMDWLRNALNDLGVKRWSTNDVMALLRRGVDAVRKSAVAKKSTNVSALVGNELTYAAREAGVVLTPEQTMRVINRDPAVTADVQARVSDARGEGAKMSVDNERSAPFYSALTKTVQALPQETMTVQQARAAIEKGAKKDEIAMSGILTDPLSPLAGKQLGDKVTKAELTGYALERQATVQEVVLGQPLGDKVKRSAQDAVPFSRQGFDGWIIPDANGDMTFAGSTKQDAADRWNDAWRPTDTPASTHFSQYQLPGADEGSYREMFVTWPGKANGKPGADFEDWKRQARKKYGDSWTRDSLTAWEKEKFDEFAAPTKWRDGHSQYSDIANPIVRIRRNIRTDADGKRTYFIEEMQGPGKGEQEKMPPELRKRIYEIGMKRALRDAVDEGADAIAWTTGAQQIDRYEEALRQNIDRLEYEPYQGDDGKPLYEINGVKAGKDVFKEEDVTPERLAELVGKDLAAKIEQGVGTSLKEERPLRPAWMAIEGKDLSIGGQGLKRLYDATLPGIANDLAKKFGVKAGTAEIRGGEKYILIEEPSGVGNTFVLRNKDTGKYLADSKQETWALRPEDGELMSESVARKLANRFAQVSAPETVHSLPIPDALKTQQRGGNTIFTANPADSLRKTSTKNAVVDEERAKLGLDPIMSEIRQSHPVVWDAAMRALERDPMAGQSLVNEINGRPRALTATEEAIILRHKINTQTAFYREMEVANDGNASPQDRMSAKLYAAQHLDAMNEIDNATRKSGTEWGRLGAFRQRLAREDYTLVAMLRKRSMATGERIEPGGAEYQFVEKLNKRIAELEAKATQDARNHAAELEQLRETAMEDAMQKMRSDGTPAQKKEREILARIAANMESAKENADAALREMGFGPVANAAGPSGDIIGTANPQDANTLDPKVLKLLSVGGANHLRKLGNDRAKWDEAMLSNYGPKVQPHLDAVWDVSQATLNDFIDGQAPKETRENTKKKILTDAEKQKRILDSIRRKSATPDKVAPYLKQLAKQLVSQGVSDRWTLLTTMETMLKDILPDATRSEIRDSLADYGEGKYRELSTDEVSVKMRRLRAQLQQEAKIEDMMRRGELPWLIGSERGEPDAETRTMIKEVNEIKKELGLEATNENQGKSARAAIKTRLRNEIEELEKFIKTRERIPSNRRSVEDDPETAQLRRDVRELRAKYQEIVGVDTMAEEAAKKSALEKSIADLQNQIVTGEIEQAAKQQTVDTPEIAALKAQKAALLEQRKALRSPSTEDIERKKEQALLDRITKLSARIATGVADAKVGKPTVESANVSAYRDIIKDLNKQLAEIRNPKKSPEQTKLDELDKRIAEVSAKIARGDLSAKQGKPTVDTAEQAVRKDTLRALNKQLADMRKAAKPTLTPDEIALKTWKTRAEKRLIDLRDRTARGDFSKKVRKVMPMDTEALKTKAALEAAKLEFDQANHKAMTANAPWWVKTMDVAQKYRRWAVLTSATVFEKLGMAAVWRTLVFQPIEDAVGSIIRHIPFIKQVAVMAPRHGQGFNTRIQLDGLIKGFASGASEAATHLKKSGNLLTGSKALSWLFGEMDEAKRLTQTPMEMLSGKRKVEPDTAWEIPGVLHAVVKDIPKMVEFHKSVAFRTKWYADRGVDVSDPLMQEKIQIESFQDAMRAISMQDNAVLNKLNRFIRSLGEPDAKTGKVNKWGKVWQTAFKVAFPIVKIPTNIVAEAFEYVSGFPAGLLNVRRAIKDGITNLQPEHADMIVRQLKKGLVGNAIFLTGFLLASNIGGYFQHGRKRDPDEVPAGGVRIGNITIHERLMHSPALLIFQAGATTARVMDSRLRKSDVDEQGLGAGLVASAMGLADEIPFVKEAFNLSALRNPYQKSHWFGAKARSIVEPTLMQWIAKLRDTDEEGNPIKRQADGFVDEMKMGIPGLRETLDVKQEKVPHARSHRR